MDKRMESTADQLLDFLGSDDGAGWFAFADLDDWQRLYNLRNEKRFVGRLVRPLPITGWPKYGGDRKECKFA